METNTEAAKAATTTEKDVRARAKETYEKFVQRLADELREAGKVGRKQWEDAVKSTREFIQKARPEVARQDIERLTETVRKDLRHALRSLRDRGEEWTRSQAFLAARDRGAQFLLDLAHRLKDAAESVESNLQETLRYRAGDVVSSGRLVCAACQEEVELEVAGALPACPKCGKDEFRRK